MCLHMGCDKAVQAVLKKLSPDRFSNSQWGRAQEIARYTSNIITLLPQLETVVGKFKENRRTPRPGVAAFYKSLVVWYAKGLEYRGSNQPITPELLKMVDLAVDAGSLSVLESLVPAIVKHVRNDAAVKAVVQDLHSRRPGLAINPQTVRSLDKMIGDMLRAMIPRNVHSSSAFTGIREWVDLCLGVQHLGACTEILRRMHSESHRMDKNALSSVLLPLLPEVWSRVALQDIGLYGPEARPLAMVSAQVVNTWVERALGYTDVSLLFRELGRCPRINCRSCKLLAQLLPVGLEREEIRLRALGITEGRHVDQQLHRSRALSLKMLNGFYKASAGWKQTRNNGLQLLRAVPGGDLFWLRILGDPGYRSLMQKLDVASINPLPPLNPSTAPNAGPVAPVTTTASKRPHSQIQSSSQSIPHTPKQSDSGAKRPRLSNNQNITVIDLTSP
ncbi:hypothetical protein M407DRAFT_215751 [Tulasnella calospora MUT 4182]|uniref:Uncharacterized protein n=1 Tax=Tulasnella calospora MUT 4182 TaxID=1051891 RepID=A0A0C3Q2V6_9AGAM|nr:hypothetical protein M407DRAFT_215751 [Tulasnella calospora MUT 4182]